MNKGLERKRCVGEEDLFISTNLRPCSWAAWTWWERMGQGQRGMGRTLGRRPGSLGQRIPRYP